MNSMPHRRQWSDAVSGVQDRGCSVTSAPIIAEDAETEGASTVPRLTAFTPFATRSPAISDWAWTWPARPLWSLCIWARPKGARLNDIEFTLALRRGRAEEADLIAPLTPPPSLPLPLLLSPLFSIATSLGLLLLLPGISPLARGEPFRPLEPFRRVLFDIGEGVCGTGLGGAR